MLGIGSVVLRIDHDRLDHELLGCEGIVSKRKTSRYRSGRSHHWVKCKNPAAPAVKREAEEDWGTSYSDAR
jgi:hypothetical protein